MMFKIRIFNFFRLISTSSSYHNRIHCDIAVIGAGIIGTSIARQLKLQHNDLEIYLVDKEASAGSHQTSHNSGVMHCGVYYHPRSLKAKFCVEGIGLLQKYCDEKNIRYEKRGKIILARNDNENLIIDKLMEQGIENNVSGLKMLESACEIREKASGCRGERALWCPKTANVDFKEVTLNLLKDFCNLNGKFLTNTKITKMNQICDSKYQLNIFTEDNTEILTQYAVLCGGLQTGVLTRLVEESSHQQFISFKVDYEKIKSKYCNNLETNVYPVPDLENPFLGAHFSPQNNDDILLGPLALPALKIEGYSNEEININYIKQIIMSCGFRNLIRRNFSVCLREVSKAVCKETRIKELQKLLPNFSYQYIEKGPTAVQCQLLNEDGTFTNDFIINVFNDNSGRNVINLKFTPSPAATSCLAIANYVAKEFNKKFTENN
ncbi:hypothetical protein ABEB36_013566 [Hypothenemus hampei]|uniref:L-2-hydroxyglutarate dehydrogenase, mitochondrial n=1 Tax=Hypothenemus hampei TaxID=57062 RepID=A0ABD1E4L2_HYPHA